MEQDILLHVLDTLNKIDAKVDKLSDDLNAAKQEVVSIKTEQTKISTKIDHGISKSLDLLIESQRDVIAHLRQLDPKVEANRDLRGRVATLESVVESHSVQIIELKKIVNQ